VRAHHRGSGAREGAIGEQRGLRARRGRESLDRAQQGRARRRLEPQRRRAALQLVTQFGVEGGRRVGARLAVEQRAREREAARADEAAHPDLYREAVELRRLERIGVALEVGRPRGRDRGLERQRALAEPPLAEHAQENAERFARRARQIVEQQHLGRSARPERELDGDSLRAHA